MIGSSRSSEADTPYYPETEWERRSPQKMGLDVAVLAQKGSLMNEAKPYPKISRFKTLLRHVVMQ